MERRTKNGTTEVSFPDGSVRLLQSDGTEKWILHDGTIVETFPDGDKILSFPNGQREVHTKEHKVIETVTSIFFSSISSVYSPKHISRTSPVTATRIS